MHRSNLGEAPMTGRRHKRMAKKKVKNLGFLEPRMGRKTKTGKKKKAKKVYSR
jgi:hypothetical protein